MVGYDVGAGVGAVGDMVGAADGGCVGMVGAGVVLCTATCAIPVFVLMEST